MVALALFSIPICIADWRYRRIPNIYIILLAYSIVVERILFGVDASEDCLQISCDQSSISLHELHLSLIVKHSGYYRMLRQTDRIEGLVQRFRDQMSPNFMMSTAYPETRGTTRVGNISIVFLVNGIELLQRAE